MLGPLMKRHRGFTLVELIIVIAVVGMVLALAVPSFRDFMLVQRLKSTNAQLVTDLMLARSEAVGRGTYLRIVFGQSGQNTCYTLYTNPPGVSNSQRCDCTRGEGLACSLSNPANPSVEVRTVVLPLSSSVRVLTPAQADPAMAFNAVTGGLTAIPTDNTAPPLSLFTIETSIDSARVMRTTIGRAGKVSVCGSNANLSPQVCP
jgi:type IV fimbrial biogenesis protein FimT